MRSNTMSDKDDCISRQVALEKLAIYIHLIDKTLGKGTLTDDDCMEAAKSVLGKDEIPAVQPESHWIPCSEKLPETYGAYLVQDVYGVIFVDHWRGDWLAKTTMVAWRELPEPYKGGDAE